MKRPAIFLFILIAAGLVIGLTLHLSNPSLNLTDFQLSSAQGANRPLAMPQDGEPDFRFHQFSAWQKLNQPIVDRLDEPMGSENGALVYNAQPFWAMNETRGGHHTGDDLNGIGGMNTDLGDPVFAAADGLVVYSGIPSPGWGRVLVLSHRLPDGKAFQTMYAHLQRIDVPLGSLIGRGQIIGAVGGAEGIYPAHLHYEIRTGDGVDIGAGYAAHPLNRVDPQGFRKPLAAAPDDLRPAVSAILQKDLAQRDAEALFNQLNNSQNREKLLEILEKK
jgi:murein DD-endopeptidase MepM/ murein hydrolase activator NlpD